MSNKTLGDKFEREFCEMLAGNGFWVHRLKQDQSGQPADVIVAKNGRAFLIDCKVCSGKGFALSRMEENQDLSMNLWKQCANGEGWFAFSVGDRIYMMQHTVIKACQGRLSSLRNEDIETWGVPLGGWLEWAQK